MKNSRLLILWLDRKSQIISRLGDFGLPNKIGLAGIVMKVWAIEVCSTAIVRYLITPSGAA